MSFKTKNYNRRMFIDHTVKGTIGILTSPFILNASKDSRMITLTKSTVVVVKDEIILDRFMAVIMILIFRF